MIRLPKSLAEIMTYKELQLYSRKLGRLEGIVRYWIDRRYAQSVNLQSWIKANIDCTEAYDELLKTYPKIEYWNQKKKIVTVLSFVHSKITYVKDNVTWKVSEKWQTPKETWTYKTGDCEDGAILIYALLHYLDVSDDRIRIVAGDVVGGGHCYVVWLSNEDGLEYVIDWCYWYSVSIKLDTPYQDLNNYFYGTKEWFSFNQTYMFKKKVK